MAGYAEQDADSPATCPMKSLRAVEMACGISKSFLQTLAESKFQQLVLPHIINAPPEVAQLLQAEFEQGRSHMALIALQKFGHWQRLPWCLAGLGHWDTTRARELGQVLLAQYDRTGGLHICIMMYGGEGDF